MLGAKPVFVFFLFGCTFALPPVILVPGLVGSVLEARMENASMPHWYCDKNRDWHKIWVSLPETLKLPCLNAELHLSFRDDEYFNTPGVFLRPRDFGGAGGINYIFALYSEWEAIIKAFAGKGYTVGKDLHGAPYDWRLAADGHSVRSSLGVGGYYADLKALIEQTVVANGEKAIIISHSLGCPTIHYFLHSYVDRQWRDAHVTRFVPMAAVWAGSPVAVQVLISGNPGAPFLPEAIWKPVQANDASSVWMLPQPEIFGNRVVLQNETHRYTAADHESILRAAGLPEGLAMYDHIRRKGAGLDGLQRFVPGLDVSFLYSTGSQTPVAFTYSGAFGAEYSSAPVNIQYGDGDGTIAAESLTAFEKWQAASSVRSSVHHFPSVSHFGMLSDQTVINVLLELADKSGTLARPMANVLV